MDSYLSMTGAFPYHDGEMNGWVLFLPKDVALSRSIGKAELVEEGGLPGGVYLPMLYRSENIQLGRPIEITIGSHTAEYTVCGFFDSVMMGFHHCTLTESSSRKTSTTSLRRSAMRRRRPSARCVCTMRREALLSSWI